MFDGRDVSMGVSFTTHFVVPSPDNLFSILLLYCLHSKYHKIIDEKNSNIIPEDSNVTNPTSKLSFTHSVLHTYFNIRTIPVITIIFGI